MGEEKISFSLHTIFCPLIEEDIIITIFSSRCYHILYYFFRFITINTIDYVSSCCSCIASLVENMTIIITISFAFSRLFG